MRFRKSSCPTASAEIVATVAKAAHENGNPTPVFTAWLGEAAVADARKHNVHGIVCGHIHHAEIREIDGITYLNDGDWVESCTAVAETEEGIFEIIRWTHPPQDVSTETLVEELEAAA